MVFDARAAAAEVDEAEEYPPFEFIGLDGETYQLPNILTFTEREALRISKGDYGPLEERSPEAFEAMQDLPLHVSTQLGEAWWAEVDDSGKLPSTPSAPNRAARRSRPTSRSGASS